MSQAATFRITTAWIVQESENPWLLSAYDEFTEDAWGGTPEFFDKELAKHEQDEVRIIDIYVDYDRIEERFAPVAVAGHIESEADHAE